MLLLFPGAFYIINFPQNVTVNQTVSASFFCNATSYPPHQALATHISWSKLGGNGKVFPTGQHLILQNVSRHEAGTYICKAENGLGLPDTAMAVLSVLRKYQLFFDNKNALHSISLKIKKFLIALRHCQRKPGKRESGE